MSGPRPTLVSGARALSLKCSLEGFFLPLITSTLCLDFCPRAAEQALGRAWQPDLPGSPWATCSLACLLRSSLTPARSLAGGPSTVPHSLSPRDSCPQTGVGMGGQPAAREAAPASRFRQTGEPDWPCLFVAFWNIPLRRNRAEQEESGTTSGKQQHLQCRFQGSDSLGWIPVAHMGQAPTGVTGAQSLNPAWCGLDLKQRWVGPGSGFPHNKVQN